MPGPRIIAGSPPVGFLPVIGISEPTLSEWAGGIGEPGGARYNNAMIQKAFDSIQKADIEALLTNQVSEVRTLEYKLQLPGGADKDKKEFLADLSSFANASGGDMLFGVDEDGGVPKAIPGLSGDMDAAKLRLENLIRDCITPRIIGVQMREIAGFASGPVLMIRVPKSFGAPHMVKVGESTRFYSRNSAGKYPMDIVELRAAFEVSGALGERLQRFRTDRLAKIVAGETPVMMPDKPKIILHILPLSAFNLTFFRGIERAVTEKFKPMGTNQWDSRVNIDGIMTFYRSRGSDSATYCQLFRNGAVEAVYADFVVHQGESKLIGSEAYERSIIDSLCHFYLPGLKSFAVPLPLLITLSMVGVKGVELATGDHGMPWSHPIDRDSLLLPDVLLEDYHCYIEGLMRPIFDAVWNAGGYEQSANYDKDGLWRPRR